MLEVDEQDISKGNAHFNENIDNGYGEDQQRRSTNDEDYNDNKRGLRRGPIPSLAKSSRSSRRMSDDS
jgi:hypothetical protein